MLTATAFCLALMLLLAAFMSLHGFASQAVWAGNPVVVGVWWDTIMGSDWTDQQLAADVHQIKLMNFTAIYCVEKGIMDGSKDDALNSTWTARMVKLAEQEDLSIVWAVWESDYPLEWQNKDLTNQTFRSWFGQHLAKWEDFIKQHSCIVEIIFDDFHAESQYLNMTEFTQFVRQYIPLPTMIEYDDVYNTLNPQYGDGTVTEGYLYYSGGGTSAWTSFWIDYLYQHYNGNYPYHTLGICLEAFDAGEDQWTPEKQLPLIDKALSYNFTHFEYWAWRWATPESPAIAAHPEYWGGIKANNEHILNPHAILGDLNGDFKVNLQDLVTLANAYGSKPGDGHWNPNADIDGNNIVDLSDLALMANHYGQHYP